jgi:CPA2 family monovalent cation:H+ antiporter-2
MPHETVLIATIAAGIGLAFIFGFIAARIGLPPLVGYLLAGIAVGPFTPGFVADIGLASQLSEIGVILLMFGVGLHFSLRDLLAVKNIAVPGAVAQIGVATLLGTFMTRFWGWSWGASLVFGLCLSVASTVVLLKALEDQGILDSINGRIAVGWLIVEDLAMVLALVLLPALAVPLGGVPLGGEHSAAAGTENLAVTLLITLAKVTAFMALMLVVGRRFVPWLLARVARIGSRELFTLAVLAIALGIAVGSAALFDVSFALGAFFAGVIISESDLSHQAAADALPLQDAFAVLFFVSVGMLFDPMIVLRQPLEVLGVITIIVVGKTLAAFGIVLLFKYPLGTALTVSASLAQIGEFSFILAGLGTSLKLLPQEGQSLVLAGALLSITLNPAVFATVKPISRWIKARPRVAERLERAQGTDEEIAPSTDHRNELRDHAIVIGHGRVGSSIAEALTRNNIPYIVVEEDRIVVESLRRQGIPALFGDASRPGILSHAYLHNARLLVIATPTSYQARQILELARKENPQIDTVVRTHSAKEMEYLKNAGVGRVVMGEHELAFSMAEYALHVFGRSRSEANETIDRLRMDTEGDDAFEAARKSRAG